jgi:hypothetical protein
MAAWVMNWVRLGVVISWSKYCPRFRVEEIKKASRYPVNMRNVDGSRHCFHIGRDYFISNLLAIAGSGSFPPDLLCRCITGMPNWWCGRDARGCEVSEVNTKMYYYKYKIPRYNCCKQNNYYSQWHPVVFLYIARLLALTLTNLFIMYLQMMARLHVYTTSWSSLVH